MTDTSRQAPWYLFDYGMVVSTAPRPSDWATLEQATGLDLRSASSSYWASREAFDAGRIGPAEYWAEVLGRPVPSADLDQLERLDAAQWSHLNPQTIAVLETLRSRRAKVALLSNMPRGMAEWHLDGSGWVGYFSRLYFSGKLGMAKPDPRIFRYVAAELSAHPEDIVFIDDNATNIAAARELGFRTILHTSQTDLYFDLSKP